MAVVRAEDGAARAATDDRGSNPKPPVVPTLDPVEEADIGEQWMEWDMGIPLSIVEAPFRDLTNPSLDEVRRYTSRAGTIVTVVLPELVVRRRWEHLLHNQTALFMKRLLLFEPNVVVTSVPFHLEEDGTDVDRTITGAHDRADP